MKPNRSRQWWAVLAVLFSRSFLSAAIPINSSPVSDPFVAVPPVGNWSTTSVGTTGATIGAAAFDAKVIATVSAPLVSTTLASSGTYPPSTNTIARYNTGANTGGTPFLQTRPTGNDYTLLMATLVNNTGGSLTTVRLAYDFSSASGGVEEVEGLRAYVSLTGISGSWVLIPGLSIDTTATYAVPDFVAANVVLPAPLPDGGTMYVLWADQNTVTGTDASHHIRNFSAGPGVDCVVSGSPSSPIRLPGGLINDPSDDLISFSAVIDGSGADRGPGWVVVGGPSIDAASNSSIGVTGNYGDTLHFSVPATEFTNGRVVVRVVDQTHSTCVYQFVVTAPPFRYPVTAGFSPAITFDFSTVGDGSYAPSDLVATEPGWSGGTAGGITLSNVQTQPLPSSQTLKYFHMTTNAALITQAVDVSALKGGVLKGQLELAFYSTSSTGLDVDPDALNFRVEVAKDGNFENTAGGNLIVANLRDVPAGTAVAFSESIAASTPHLDLNVAGFPASNFVFHPFAASIAVPGDASAPLARIVAQGFSGITNTEHLLVDNITFSANSSPTVDATAVSTATWFNNGTVTPADDYYTVPVKVSSFNIGASTGWTSNETPVRTGLYATANPVVFGPYFGRAATSVRLVDTLAPSAMSSVLLFNPQQPTLTASLVGGTLVREENGPGDADDTVTIQLNVASTNAGPGFTVNGVASPAHVAGVTNYPAVGTPVTVAVTNIPTSATTLELVIADASYPTTPAPITVVIAVPAAVSPETKVIGQTNFGSGVEPLLASGVPAPEWNHFPASRALFMNAGIATDSVVDSEVIDLSTVGAVQFSAQFVARETSNSSNFEKADRFKAELIIDGGLVTEDVINLVSAYDDGDGSSAVTVGVNGPPDGYINGYLGTAGTDLVTGLAYVNAEAEYNGNRSRDEFNSGNQVADFSLANTFNLTAMIPADASTVQLRITGAAISGTETFLVSDVLFSSVSSDGDSDGDGVGDADEVVMGTDPQNAADVLRFTQSGGMITFSSKPGRFYRVYLSDDNDGASHLSVWKDSGLTALVGDGGPKSFALAVVPGVSRRFYRLHVMQSDGPWPTTVP